jgi:Lrp/AsnC family leucine-responsive transcriptional regulator
MTDLPNTLTRADGIMLSRLQRDARVTIEALAQEAGLSASSAQRRLQRLREAGVIAGEVVIVEPRAAGLPLTLLVELELDHDRPEHLPGLHSWIARTGEVQSAWQVTGRGDYVLVVVAASIESFDEFMTEMMAANRNVRKFTTRVALKTLKRSLAVPINP